MPEGHLIHRYALDQERMFAGRSVRVRSPQGRFTEEARRLDDRRVDRIEAYGKHLFYWWEGGDVLHVHLGMQGKFLPVRGGSAPLPQSRMRIESGGNGVDLVAPRACRLVGPEGREAIVGRLGPDPLREDADREMVRRAIQSPRAVGALLLDQSVVSGIGNVLRAEGLFLAGIHPSRPGHSLSDQEFALLWSGLVAMMRLGVAEGRIITLRPAGASVEGVPESEGRYVYKQQRCRRCGTPVEVWELGGRTAYACPKDQPPKDPDHPPR